jgi:hypothetical protein
MEIKEATVQGGLCQYQPPSNENELVNLKSGLLKNFEGSRKIIK